MSASPEQITLWMEVVIGYFAWMLCIQSLGPSPRTDSSLCIGPGLARGTIIKFGFLVTL